MGLDEEMELENGEKKAVTNFDNAATTPALQPVMDEVDSQLEKYGSIGRGFSPKSDYSTALYNNTRDKVLPEAVENAKKLNAENFNLANPKY